MSVDTTLAMPVEKLEEELLALPRVVREHLAGVLSSSLDDGDVARVWDAEADRRFRAYLAGELTSVPAKDAIAQLRSRLRK